MKKLIYAAGVLSLGGASLAVQAAEGDSKPWTVSLTTQGFYDSNINTQPDGDGKIGSWGIYVSPSVDYTKVWDASTLTLGASYGANYFFETDDTFDSDWAQSAAFDVDFKHNFNPRVSLDISDSFQLFQNASQVLMGQTGRVEGNNISNDGNINMSVELTPRFSTVVGYQNLFYKYEKDQYAASLDRMENYGTIDLKYLVRPTTVALIGGKGGNVDYNSGLGLYVPGAPINSVGNPDASIRNTRTYFAYGGIEQSFSPTLTGSLKAGAQVQDWVNYEIDNQASPYLDFSLSYAYDVGSRAQFGVIHRANSTDLIGTSYASVVTDGPVLNQESTAFYVNVSHAITAKLTGSILATYQASTFVGGEWDGSTEDWWSVGATLSYAFNRYLSAQASYYFDTLDSQVEEAGNFYRNYNRNRVFFGIVATY